MALVVSKNIELQTNTSTRKFIHECKKITDARLKNQITGKEIRIRANLNPTTIEILRKLGLLT
jgi:hypothetical protein